MAEGTRMKKAPMKPSSETGGEKFSCYCASHYVLRYRRNIKEIPVDIFCGLNNFFESIQLVVLQFRLT